MLKVLVALLALTASACTSYISPVARTNVAIAVTGFDGAMRGRFSREAPDGFKDVGLSLNFSTAIPVEQCERPTPRGVRYADIITFQIGEVIETGGTQVLVMNGSAGPDWLERRMIPGRYTLRDVSLHWADFIHFSSGESNMAIANSTPESLSFDYQGGPTFVGFYRMMFNTRDEVVLMKEEPSPDILAAVTERMGLAAAPVAVPTSQGENRNCHPGEGIRRSGVDR